MRKRIIELEMENAHPKKGGDYLRQKRLARYRFIESQKVAFPIKLLCRVMKVNRSVYYAYAKRRTYRKTDCAAAIKECFDFNRRRYGSRGIAAELQIGYRLIAAGLERARQSIELFIQTCCN